MVYTQHINPGTRVGVWHLAEDESYFLKTVSLEKEISHPHKRLQHLAGRYLLKELFEDFPLQSILISETRKPFLKNDHFHFSISHCGDYAAAIVSRTQRVGADIEIPQDKIQNISRKFISNEERERFGEFLNGPDHLTIVWSIKETVFKWYGKGGVDFRKDIRINEINLHDNELKASADFSADGKLTELKVRGVRINGNWLCWLAT